MGEEAETLHRCLCYYPLYKLFFFCLFFLLLLRMLFRCYGNLSFHRFIMGQVKVGLYFYQLYSNFP